jgi:hypothetical protein
MQLLGFEPDPWQIAVLEGNVRRGLLNCCRQAGKSTVIAVLALVEAMYNPDTLVILLSPDGVPVRPILNLANGASCTRCPS